MAEQDVSNFSTSSSHRLPTVSASQALRNIPPRSRWIPTGMPRLDRALKGDSKATSLLSGAGGIQRGSVTEVYGPPGVGKTSFAMRVTANALQAGDRVVWIDTGSPIAGPRLKAMLSSHLPQDEGEIPSSPPVFRSVDDLLNNLLHFQVHTLPHLLALLLSPPEGFPPEGTSLIVIDTISSLFSTTFARAPGAVSGWHGASEAKKTNAQWAANRKWSVIGDLVSKLGRVATLKHIAVLVTSQTITKVRGGAKAMLRPAISGTAWESGINCRILLFRDWPPSNLTSDDTEDETIHAVRYAEVLKVSGKMIAGTLAFEPVVPFAIEVGHLRELNVVPLSQDLIRNSPVLEQRPTKRKHEEIADSEDEADELGSDDDFGLGDEDLLREAFAATNEEPSGD